MIRVGRIIMATQLYNPTLLLQVLLERGYDLSWKNKKGNTAVQPHTAFTGVVGTWL